MSSPATSVVNNLFLDRLSPDLRGAILARTEPVSLPIRTGIYSSVAPPEHIHFVTSGSSRSSPPC